MDPDPAVPVVLVAGGIGITPMMSMLGWCQAEQPQRTVHLYYGLRQGGEHAFKQPLAALAAANPLFHLNVVYSNAAPDDVRGRDYQYAGHVDAELLRHTLPPGRHRFYLCGPPAMMASLVPALSAWGVSAEVIRHEAFGPASMQAADVMPPQCQRRARGQRFARRPHETNLTSLFGVACLAHWLDGEDHVARMP